MRCLFVGGPLDGEPQYMPYVEDAQGYAPQRAVEVDIPYRSRRGREARFERYTYLRRQICYGNGLHKQWVYTYAAMPEVVWRAALLEKGLVDG